MSGRDPRERFSDRAAAYVLARPTYPGAIFDAMGALAQQRSGHSGPWFIADVGSGTGISVAPWLERGHQVAGVEPNAEMRAEAVTRFASEPRFRAVDGSAEATTLPDSSVDVWVAAQAFHWFPQTETRAELSRILRPTGLAAVIWNERLPEADAFGVALEAALVRHCPEYPYVDHRRYDRAKVEAFLGKPLELDLRVAHSQPLTWELLTARLASSSYVPPPGTDGWDVLLREVGEAFERHAADGLVAMHYAAVVYAR